MSELYVYNSLTRTKELFEPIHKGHIGMYVCGPTVYSDVHLGNIRTFMSFDVIYRYLKYLGYKVRYVRNITDVGHLVGDQDEGEDKIAQRAKLENLEPMEVVQKYTNGFHKMMRTFNLSEPSIEPRATGHIMEQIEMVQKILNKGHAYEKNGSVYFDVQKFAQSSDSYGNLSGRVLEDLISETRDLKKQDEKKNPADFAIWMKADDRHIMKWQSKWSEGFPGWHLECSAMSTKYLGDHFDIHGGGTDLKFPHHENEIAQNVSACGCAPAKYWLHTNMLLMNGRKMAKSDGNTISAQELFTGESPHVSKGYSPMTIRFFILMAHYRSTLDLSDEALLAAEKGYKKLMDANQYLQQLSYESTGNISDVDKTIQLLTDKVFDELNDDFNTPKTLARLFELVPIINSHRDAKPTFRDISQVTLIKLKNCFQDVLVNIMGLMDESGVQDSSLNETLNGVMDLVLDLRQNARTSKDWTIADKIREHLTANHIVVKDGKEGTTWSFN